MKPLETPRNGLLRLLVGVAVALACCPACEDTAKEQTVRMERKAQKEKEQQDWEDYQKDAGRIEALYRVTGLSSEEKIHRVLQLEALAQEIERDWADRNAEHYGRLMHDLITSIGSIDVSYRPTSYIAQNLALRALEKADRMPLDTHCELLGWTGINVDPNGQRLDGFAWAALRKRSVALKLAGWQRIVQTIDEEWDPDDLPSLQVWTSTGELVACPEEIQDPKVRARYIADVEANRLKIERNTLQSTARDLKKQWMDWDEKSLVELYATDPDRLEELDALLVLYIDDEAMRTRILNAVEEQQRKSMGPSDTGPDPFEEYENSRE